jgi:HEAT repeat protein
MLGPHAAQRGQQPSTAPTSALSFPLSSDIEALGARLSSANVEERREAVMQLGLMKRPDASRIAAVALGDPAPGVRAMAAQAVLALPADQAAALLLPLLRNKKEKEFVRREVAYALGQTRSRAAVQGLIAALETDKEASVRAAAAIALGQIGDSSAVPVLVQTFSRRRAPGGFLNRITRQREENEFVRRSAIHALGQIGDSSALPDLIEALTSERAEADVRREAAQALGQIGDPAAIPALRGALEAADPYLSRAASDAIKLIESKRGLLSP